MQIWLICCLTDKVDILSQLIVMETNSRQVLKGRMIRNNGLCCSIHNLSFRHKFE